MSTKVRYIIQELVGSEWKLACARDTLDRIMIEWEDMYLPLVNRNVRQRGAHCRTCGRQFRIMRATPNAMTLVDPADHSQRHRLEMRKIELEAR